MPSQPPPGRGEGGGDGGGGLGGGGDGGGGEGGGEGGGAGGGEGDGNCWQMHLLLLVQEPVLDAVYKKSAPPERVTHPVGSADDNIVLVMTVADPETVAA